jgi:ribosome-associated heat shock protein Hsp15
MAQKSEEDDKVRLDKWLWAARFYKTRALAKAAIESGKVHCRGSAASLAKSHASVMNSRFARVSKNAR